MNASIEHTWEIIEISILGGLWRCSVCGACTNNAFLMDLRRICPGPTVGVVSIPEKS